MNKSEPLVQLSTQHPVWERFFSVFPLVLVGTREAGGGWDTAPKHMAMPVSWDNYFGFVCTERHATLRNIRRTEFFTVSYPRPGHVLDATLAAGPRDAEDRKPMLADLPLVPASVVPGMLVADCDVYLECRLERTVEGLGENTLVIGSVVAAQVTPAALRSEDREDNALVHEAPLLAYLHPRRFAAIGRSHGLPLPNGFCR